MSSERFFINSQRSFQVIPEINKGFRLDRTTVQLGNVENYISHGYQGPVETGLYNTQHSALAATVHLGSCKGQVTLDPLDSPSPKGLPVFWKMQDTCYENIDVKTQWH